MCHDLIPFMFQLFLILKSKLSLHTTVWDLCSADCCHDRVCSFSKIQFSNTNKHQQGLKVTVSFLLPPDTSCWIIILTSAASSQASLSPDLRLPTFTNTSRFLTCHSHSNQLCHCSSNGEDRQGRSKVWRLFKFPGLALKEAHRSPGDTKS